MGIRGVNPRDEYRLLKQVIHAYTGQDGKVTHIFIGTDNKVGYSIAVDVKTGIVKFVDEEFGNILKETGDIPNRLTYTGQLYDGAAVQYYLRARFYNPVIGRFMKEDIYHGDGLNLYAYCANNPVMYYDPSGHGICPMELTQPGNDGSGETGGYSESADGMSPEDAARYIVNNKRAVGGRYG